MPDASEYSTTDQELIVFLIAMKSRILRTKKNDRNRTIFFFDKDSIQLHLDKWLSGEPIMIEVRVLFAAQKIFNMYVHGDC